MFGHLHIDSLHDLVSSVLLAQAAAPAGAAPNPFSSMLPFVLILGAAYFLLIRPMSKEEKVRKTRVAAIEKGTEVVLQGGIIGRISNWDDPRIAVVEIADKVKIRVLKKDISDTKEHVLSAMEANEKKAAPNKGADKADDKDKAEARS